VDKISLVNAIALLRQLSSVRRTAAAASRSLLTLPHSFRAAALTGQEFVSGRSTVLARVHAPAASRRLLDVFSAERTCLLVVAHGFRDQDEGNRDLQQ
jgi:hypothetical protein